MIVADTRVLLDFLDGEIADPFELARPYGQIFISPVTLHETLRAFPKEYHRTLIENLTLETLPVPSLEDWISSAQALRDLYPSRKDRGVARMQNDILICLSAKTAQAPVWSRDKDFADICDYFEVGLLTA